MCLFLMKIHKIRTPNLRISHTQMYKLIISNPCLNCRYIYLTETLNEIHSLYIAVQYTYTYRPTSVAIIKRTNKMYNIAQGLARCTLYIIVIGLA